MASQKELRAAFVAGAVMGLARDTNLERVEADAKRRYPPKTTTRLREIKLPSRMPAPLNAKYRFVASIGEIQWWDVASGLWQRWLNGEDTNEVLRMLNNPWETVEVEE